jgi:heptosyltransferase III
MAQKKYLIKLYLYLLGHFLLKGIRNPQALLTDIQSARKIIQSKGLSKAKEELLFSYLPKNYLLKTKLHIAEPSYSIFKKLKKIAVEGYFKAPTPQTIERMATKQKILVIRSGAMGDVLLATPVIRKLFQDRDGFCEIDIATKNTEVFKNNPYINKTLHPKELQSLNNAYDLIINLDMALEKNKAAHITQVYSFFTFGSISNNANSNLQAELFSAPIDIQNIQTFIKELNNGYIVCHNRVDPTQPYRNVPLDSWQNLLKKIVQGTNLTIIQIGMPDMDVAIDHPNMIDARGQFNLHELKELISQANLFLGTDAGPLHVAACTETPIISFFTLAHHETRKPLRSGKDHLFKAITPDINCYGCVKDYPLAWGFECQRGDFICTKKFNIQEAVDSTLSMLEISK